MNKLTAIFTTSLFIIGSFCNNDGFTKYIFENESQFKCNSINVEDSYIILPSKKTETNNINFTENNIVQSVKTVKKDNSKIENYKSNKNITKIAQNNSKLNTEFASIEINNNTSNSNNIIQSNNNDDFEVLKIDQVSEEMKNKQLKEKYEGKKSTLLSNNTQYSSPYHFFDPTEISEIVNNCTTHNIKKSKNLIDDFEIINTNEEETTNGFRVLSINSTNANDKLEQKLNSIKSNTNEYYDVLLKSIKSILSYSDNLLQNTYFTTPKYKVVQVPVQKFVNTKQYKGIIKYNQHGQIEIPNTKIQVPEVNYKRIYNELKDCTTEFSNLLRFLIEDICFVYKELNKVIDNINSNNINVSSKTEILNDLVEYVNSNIQQSKKIVGQLLFGNDNNSAITNNFDNYMQTLNNIKGETQKPTFITNKYIGKLSTSVQKYILDIMDQYNNMQQQLSNIIL